MWPSWVVTIDTRTAADATLKGSRAQRTRSQVDQFGITRWTHIAALDPPGQNVDSTGTDYAGGARGGVAATRRRSRGAAPQGERNGTDASDSLGREPNGRFGVRNVNKQTFVHGDCHRQPSPQSGSSGQLRRRPALVITRSRGGIVAYHSAGPSTGPVDFCFPFAMTPSGGIPCW